MRLFVTDVAGENWSELTSGDRPAVRLAASDLQRAQRGRARIRAGGSDVAVILDVTVAVAADFRSARASAAARAASETEEGTLRYVGTVDGLTGLIADIDSAGVADGVTLISSSPRADLRTLGQDVLRRLELRGRASA